MKAFKKLKNSIVTLVKTKHLLLSFVSLVGCTLLLAVATFAWFAIADPSAGGIWSGVIDDVKDGYNIQVKIDDDTADGDGLGLKNAIPGKSYRITLTVESETAGSELQLKVIMADAIGSLYDGYNRKDQNGNPLPDIPNDDVLKFFSISYLLGSVEANGIEGYDPTKFDDTRTIYSILNDDEGVIGEILGTSKEANDGKHYVTVQFYITVSNEDPARFNEEPNYHNDINRFQGSKLVILGVSAEVTANEG